MTSLGKSRNSSNQIGKYSLAMRQWAGRRTTINIQIGPGSSASLRYSTYPRTQRLVSSERSNYPLKNKKQPNRIRNRTPLESAEENPAEEPHGRQQKWRENGVGHETNCIEREQQADDEQTGRSCIWKKGKFWKCYLLNLNALHDLESSENVWRRSLPKSSWCCKSNVTDNDCSTRRSDADTGRRIDRRSL